MNVVRAAFSSLAAVPGHMWESIAQPSLMALPHGTRRYTILIRTLSYNYNLFY